MQDIASKLVRLSWRWDNEQVDDDTVENDSV